MNLLLRCSLRILVAAVSIYAIAAPSTTSVFSTAETPTPDFAAARDETAAILSGFIKVDTSNPPGNAWKAGFPSLRNKHRYVQSA
jgi:hypothetical protein